MNRLTLHAWLLASSNKVEDSVGEVGSFMSKFVSL